jgi:hypothetical protein
MKKRLIQAMILLSIIATNMNASMMDEAKNMLYGVVNVTKDNANILGINADINKVDVRLKKLYLELGKTASRDMVRGSRLLSREAVKINSKIEALLLQKANLEKTKVLIEESSD